MHLFTVELRPYRKLHAPLMGFLLLFVVASYVLVNMNSIFLLQVSILENISDILIVLFIGLSFMHASRQRKMIQEMRATEDFESRKQLHFKLYKYRLTWSFVNGLITCVMFVCTAKQFWFYFSLFDVLIFFLQLPNKKLIARELQRDDIDFIN